MEVCSVADKELLKAIKIENNVATLLQKSELRGFEIEKIEKHFPGTLPVDLVAKVETKIDKQLRFAWESLGQSPDLFLRPPMNPHLDLKKEIETALKKKSVKKHAGKDHTIIVLDNLTTHSEPEEFFGAVDDLGDFLDELPFKSIWLYTGYYSDDDGYGCEYSLVPIKLSDEEARYLAEHGPR